MDVSFLSPLDVEQVQDGIHPTWKLLKSFSVKVNDNDGGRVFIVPVGFITDFASIPRIPPFYDIFGNTFSKSATIHDWLYSTQAPIVTLSYANDVLLAGMRTEGYPWYKYVPVYITVKLFGRLFFRVSSDSSSGIKFDE